MNLAKITQSLLSDSPVILVFVQVRYIWKFWQNHYERGHQITVGYVKIPFANRCSIFAMAGPYLST